MQMGEDALVSQDPTAAEKRVRTYYTRRALLRDGTVQLRARWSAVPTFAMAIGMTGLPAAFLPIDGALGLAVLAILAVLAFLLLVAPPRRILTFDKVGRVLHIRHCGVLAERKQRDLGFDEIESVEVAHAGNKGAYTLETVHAKLRGAAPVYLCTIYDDAETTVLKREMAAIFSP